MTSIDPIGTTPAALGTSGPAGTTSAPDALSQLDNSQTFLQLLVAQLKYQDPLNPTDGTQFIAQTAQLTEVQSVTSLVAKVGQELAAQQAATATGMLGKQVTAHLADGTTVSGTATGVSLGGSGEPVLDVGSAQVPLSAVTAVAEPATPPAAG